MASPSRRTPATLSFLIDECLSDFLVATARSRGYEAMHVHKSGHASQPDAVLARLAFQQDLILVTNNARDFRRLYRKFTVHPGLVIILPSVRTPRQIELFEAVIRFIEAETEIVNQLVQVDRHGTVSIQPWPPVPL